MATPKFSYSSIVSNTLEHKINKLLLEQEHLEKQKQQEEEKEQNEQNEQVQYLELEKVNSLRNIYNELPNLKSIDRSFIKVPKFYNNLYSRWNTVKWLSIPIDDNYYNYDYCMKLFGMFKKWIRINNLTVKIPEYILFSKFLSLIYLLSNKSKLVPKKLLMRC
jgi:hypothetical protein